MPERHLPDWLTHAPVVGVRGFAALGGTEAMIRGILVSVMPVEMYRAFGDAGTVSTLYFILGLVSLGVGLMVPWATRHVPRRWMFTLGATGYLAGAGFALVGGPFMAAAVGCNMAATVTVFVCLNAYILDYIARTELGRTETLRMFYSGLAWTAGPVTGVALLELWRPAPFLIAGGFSLALLALFWWMRLGNGKLIQRARGPAPNPLAFLGRFAAQPRLVAGYAFAVIRACGWWVYVVYLPIFAVEAGLSPKLGGITMSITSAALFLTPLMLRWTRTRPVRTAVRLGFFASGGLFLLAAALAALPWGTIGVLVAASLFLILLDVVGGLPFLMAVKPSERTEMAAIYATFRDAAGIFSPGLAWLVLLVAPLPGIFAATGAALLAAGALAGVLHPRLGLPRRGRAGPGGRAG